MHPRTTLALLFSASLLLPLISRADDDDDDDERGGRVAAVQNTALWKPYAAECGTCHLAFPPAMLPARSWKALLGGLDDHFGQNAELDAATRQKLEGFLTANAGRDVAGPTPLRITQLRSWLREHDEIPASTFKRKAVSSPANCAACHPGADQGAFSEHQVKIPRDAPAPR